MEVIYGKDKEDEPPSDPEDLIEYYERQAEKRKIYPHPSERRPYRPYIDDPKEKDDFHVH